MTPSTDFRGLAHLPPAEGRARVEAVLAALPSMLDPDVRERIAHHIPSTVAALAPEVCRALSTVAAKLWAHTPRLPIDIDTLPAQRRIPWRRVQIALGHLPADDVELLWCVTGWSVDALMTPAPLVERMLTATDPRLRLMGLRWLTGAVTGLGMTAVAACDAICARALDTQSIIRCAALRHPHFLADGLSLTQESTREDALLAGVNDAEPRVVRAALHACARLGRRDWLLDYLGDEQRPVALRAEALTQLGPLAEASDLTRVFAAGATLGLEAATRACVLAAHRRGSFIDAAHLDALLDHFDRWPAWTAEEIDRIAYTQRAALMARLGELPFDDRRWIRRAALLAQRDHAEARAILSRALAEVQSVPIATAFIDAAGRAPRFNDPAGLWAWLSRAPEAVLRAVRQRGGSTAPAELERFILTPGIDHPVRAQAIEALWALTADRAGVLRRLSMQLGPQEAGVLDPARRIGRDFKAQVLADTPWDDRFTVPAAARLRAFTASSDPRFVPQVEALFRAQVSALVARALAGDFRVKRVELPALTQQIYAYGRRLLAEGRVVRGYVDDAPSTGRDLLFAFIGRWLDATPDRAVTVALLEIVAQHEPDRAMLRRIEPYWRHADREVRRAAIDAILAAESAGLAFSLSRLVTHSSARIAERGLKAIEAFGDPAWAEPLARAALARPPMNIKRAAAEALACCGTAASVPALVAWLGRHDNLAFRAALGRALTHAAGADAARALVDALDQAPDDRSRDLLLDALCGRLSLAGVCRVLHADRPAARWVVDAAVSGRLRVTDASAEAVRAHLHQARWIPAPSVEVTPEIIFVQQGFSPERAVALLTRWPTAQAVIEAAVRGAFAAWVTWCAQGAPALAVQIALRVAQPVDVAQFDVLLERLALAPTADALSFVTRCLVTAEPPLRWRAIEAVRGLPAAAEPGGLARYRLLGSLGALQTTTDLRACLAECAQGPAFDTRSADLLIEALGVSTTDPADEARLIAARRWHQRSPADREAWLSATLATQPLGVGRPTALPEMQPWRPTLLTATDLARLRAELDAPSTRDAAAHAILNAPGARVLWPEVLTRWLANALDVAPADLPVLAAQLEAWPSAPRAQALAPYLSVAQQRAFVPGWIAARAQGDATADALLRQVGERLRPFVWAGKAADPTLARLVRLDPPLRAWLAAHAPAELPPEAAPAVAPDTAPAIDPIEGLDLEGLAALVTTKTTAPGLAVRGVHAAAQHGEAAIELIAGWAVDPRPGVRSAALRALRTIAPRTRRLDAVVAALGIETRRDEIVRLLRVLGHGRWAVDTLITHLTHRDPKVVAAAHAALNAYGSTALPALHRAHRRARPDRRARFEAIIEALT